MMRREGAVDRLVQQNMLPGKLFGQLDDDFAGRAVAAIPGDIQWPRTVVIPGEARDVIVEDPVLRDRSARRCRRAEPQRPLAELLDGVTKKRLAAEHQLETVMV